MTKGRHKFYEFDEKSHYEIDGATPLSSKPSTLTKYMLEVSTIHERSFELSANPPFNLDFSEDKPKMDAQPARLLRM